MSDQDARRKKYLEEIRELFAGHINTNGQFYLSDLAQCISMGSVAVLVLPHPSHPETEKVLKLRDFLNYHYPPDSIRDVDAENAQLGKAFMEAYNSVCSAPPMDRYSPSNCPSEILYDLVNRLQEAVIS